MKNNNIKISVLKICTSSNSKGYICDCTLGVFATLILISFLNENKTSERKHISVKLLSLKSQLRQILELYCSYIPAEYIKSKIQRRHLFADLTIPHL
jgi:hypothetical protein